MSDSILNDVLGLQTSNTSASTGPSLTLAKLASDIRKCERLMATLPPPPRIDLYGSRLIDQCYELKVDEHKWLWPPMSKGRRLIVCPKAKLEFWADTFRKAGADVRVEPRMLVSKPCASS